jgi:hypothetical protein
MRVELHPGNDSIIAAGGDVIAANLNDQHFIAP